MVNSVLPRVSSPRENKEIIPSILVWCDEGGDNQVIDFHHDHVRHRITCTVGDGPAEDVISYRKATYSR